jgi:hypothetical protein
MPIQDTYDSNIPAAYAGQIANMVAATLISRSVEDASGLGLGVPAYQGANDNGCSATGTDLIGVTVRDRNLDPATPNVYGQYESARIMTQGAIWVQVSSAVSAGDAVTVTGAGEFSTSGGTTVPGARFDTSADTDGLAVIRMTGTVATAAAV